MLFGDDVDFGVSGDVNWWEIEIALEPKQELQSLCASSCCLSLMPGSKRWKFD